jgi:hypothetical protein
MKHYPRTGRTANKYTNKYLGGGRLRSILLAATMLLTPLTSHSSHAQPILIGPNTSGDLHELNVKTGELTLLTGEPLTNISLGPTVLSANKKLLYYVGVPSGSSENALYTLNIAASTLSHIDLDRSDEVRALLVKGRKLYGLFYDSTSGNVAIYQINASSGATTLVVDLTDLEIEPIGGAITQVGSDYYLLVRPNANYNLRLLLRFKLKANSGSVSALSTKQGAVVACDKFQPLPSATGGSATPASPQLPKGFLCLAPPADGSATNPVQACKVTLKGEATCTQTLEGIERLSSGHTFLKHKNSYYLLAYATGETNNQLLLRLNAKGQIKANTIVDTLFIGAAIR